MIAVVVSKALRIYYSFKSVKMVEKLVMQDIVEEYILDIMKAVGTKFTFMAVNIAPSTTTSIIILILYLQFLACLDLVTPTIAVGIAKAPVNLTGTKFPEKSKFKQLVNSNSSQVHIERHRVMDYKVLESHSWQVTQ